MAPLPLLVEMITTKTEPRDEDRADQPYREELDNRAFRLLRLTIQMGSKNARESRCVKPLGVSCRETQVACVLVGLYATKHLPPSRSRGTTARQANDE